MTTPHSRCTPLLRLVRALPGPDAGEAEVLGIDDFAFRKGRHYGMLPVDEATHRPLHLFDGGGGEDLAAWLRRHPEVKVGGGAKPSPGFRYDTP